LIGSLPIIYADFLLYLAILRVHDQDLTSLGVREMEPISLILTALASGAAAVLKDSAGDAIKTAYEGLKGLIIRKLTGRPRAEMVMAGHEENPEAWQAPLKIELQESGADRDEQIIRAAKALADLVAPEASRSYTMNIQNLGEVGRQINIQHAERVGFDEEPES
jgi:predicted ATPase